MNQQLVKDNQDKLEKELARIKLVLGHQDQADGKGEFPGDFKPKFAELGSEDGENASEVEQFANDLGVTNDLEDKMVKIVAALERIKNGTYTQCKEGDEIEEARLQALPEADTCMKHSG